MKGNLLLLLFLGLVVSWLWGRTVRWRMRPHGRTYVYRLYDKRGALLYVGITSNVNRRLRQHKQSKSWYGSVHHVVVKKHWTRRGARFAEKVAILKDHPRHNLRL